MVGAGSPPWEATSPQVAMVRWHGRNPEIREKNGLASSAERFEHLYSECELIELSGSIQDLAANAQRVHVLFNNNQDYARHNAGSFGRCVRQAFGIAYSMADIGQ